ESDAGCGARAGRSRIRVARAPSTRQGRRARSCERGFRLAAHEQDGGASCRFGRYQLRHTPAPGRLPQPTLVVRTVEPVRRLPRRTGTSGGKRRKEEKPDISPEVSPPERRIVIGASAPIHPPRRSGGPPGCLHPGGPALFARNKEVCLGRSAAASGPCCARPEDRPRDTLQTPLSRLRAINARKSGTGLP